MYYKYFVVNDPTTNKPTLKVYGFFYADEFINDSQPYGQHVVGKLKSAFSTLIEDPSIMETFKEETNLKIQSYICIPQVFGAAKDVKTTPRSSKVVSLKTSLNTLIQMCANEVVKEITQNAEDQVRESQCPDLRTHYPDYHTLTDMLLCESVYCFVVKGMSKHKKLGLFEEGECPARVLEKRLWEENYVPFFEDYVESADSAALRMKKFRAIKQNAKRFAITGDGFLKI